MKILVTGSEGLIGRHLLPRLEMAGFATRAFDLRRSVSDDVRNPQALAAAVDGVEGIVHLAAVSRVVWGERDPANCVATNVTALQQILDISAKSKFRPWVFFVSSREVYGNSASLPVSEDAALQPINIYARTKQEGERLVLAARDRGVVTNTARLSSVYGWVGDHDDRVVPAFASAAARGGGIRIDGRSNTLDFTFIDDVVDGLARFVIATARGDPLPVIHFVSGRGISLGDLAEIAARNAPQSVNVVENAPRAYAVSHFVGDPSRAVKLLGWSAKVPVEQGIAWLIKQYVASQSS